MEKESNNLGNVKEQDLNVMLVIFLSGSVLFTCFLSL